jgi:hypothetical protein
MNALSHTTSRMLHNNLRADRHYLMYFLVVSNINISNRMTISLAGSCCEKTDCPVQVGLVGVQQLPSPLQTGKYFLEKEKHGTLYIQGKRIKRYIQFRT